MIARMREAIVYGLIASSALVLGSVIGTQVRLPARVLALLLAFASGALMTALAFELFEDAHDKSGIVLPGVAFAAGAAVFVGATFAIDRLADTPSHEQRATDVAASDAPDARRPAAAAAGFALLAAVTLDGVPENMALGVTLAEGAGSVTLLFAVFASNLPESIVGAAAMQSGGRSARAAIGLWCLAAVFLAAAVVVGSAVFPPENDHAVSIPRAFAAGAVIASLADTLMPEAFEGGGPTVAFATTGGFLVSYILSTA